MFEFPESKQLAWNFEKSLQKWTPLPPNSSCFFLKRLLYDSSFFLAEVAAAPVCPPTPQFRLGKLRAQHVWVDNLEVQSESGEHS